MAGLSRTVIYGGLGVISIALVWAYGGDAPEKKAKASATTAKLTGKKSLEPKWNFAKEDLAARFPKPVGTRRNVFKALVEVERPTLNAEEEEIMKLPATLTDGESDWAYTGMVEVDGRRLALLENPSTHQGGYVREGETWKKARIVRITMPSIVLAGPDGEETTIFRFNPNKTPKPKPPPESGFRPMDLGNALKGPIGVELRKEPGPAVPSPSMSASPDPIRKEVVK